YARRDSQYQRHQPRVIHRERDAALSQVASRNRPMDSVARIKTTIPSPYPLTAIYIDTHDTRTFRFGLPADATLDMLPGDHLYVHATSNGKSVKRPYTPSSLPGTVGFFDLTVKRYETGTISKYLHDQRIGDTVLMSGPR